MSLGSAGARHGLLLSTIHAYRWSLCRAIIPRVLLIAFKYSQPFLIDALLSLLVEDRTPLSIRKGHAMVAAYVLVYTGIAVSHQFPCCILQVHMH
jgi:ATP-binding cassette subfamily C (CFTR/MRP) protein 1